MKLTRLHIIVSFILQAVVAMWQTWCRVYGRYSWVLLVDVHLVIRLDKAKERSARVRLSRGGAWIKTQISYRKSLLPHLSKTNDQPAPRLSDNSSPRNTLKVPRFTRHTTPPPPRLPPPLKPVHFFYSPHSTARLLPGNYSPMPTDPDFFALHHKKLGAHPLNVPPPLRPVPRPSPFKELTWLLCFLIL